MCWSVPGRVLDVGAGTAVVECGGRSVNAALLTLDQPVRAGDWVLVRSGLILARLTEPEARDALALQQELRKGETS